MKKSILYSAALTIVMLLCAFSISAQDAVKWSSSVRMTSQTEGVITVTGIIADGWHMYGFNMPEDGPVSTTITMTTPKEVKWTGPMRMSPAPISKVDDMFGIKVSYWENKVTFSRKFVVNGPVTSDVVMTINFMACNDSNCQPPKDEVIKIKIGK